MTGEEKLSVLVVEDDFFVKEEIKRVVVELDHIVVGEAVNGLEGLEKAISLNPDVILMDISMAIVDGLEAADRIQSAKPTPIIFITAHDSEDMVQKAGRAGASAFLTKPLDSSSLRNALIIARARHADVMELRRLNAELTEKARTIEIALAEIRTLRGTVSICAHCKGIRDNEGYWQTLEEILSEQTDAQLSHGICPTCAAKEFPEIYERLKKRGVF